jgi:hypothetical protein
VCLDVGAVPGGAGSTYAAFGFGRSVAGTWGFESLRFYASAALSGREMHSSHGGDVHQMGGDVVLDAAGRVVLAHYSRSSVDRPSVAALLEACRRAAGGGQSGAPTSE